MAVQYNAVIQFVPLLVTLSLNTCVISFSLYLTLDEANQQNQPFRHSKGSDKAQRVKNWRPRKINEKKWKFPDVAHADLIRIQPRHLQDLVKVGRPLIFSLAHFYSDYWRRVVNVIGDRVAAAPVPHWPLGWGSTLLLMLEWKIGIIFSTFGPVSTFSSWGNIL